MSLSPTSVADTKLFIRSSKRRSTSKSRPKHTITLDSILQNILDDSPNCNLRKISDIQIPKKIIINLRNKQPNAMKELLDYFNIVIRIPEGVNSDIYLGEFFTLALMLHAHESLLTSSSKKRSSRKAFSVGGNFWKKIILILFIIGLCGIGLNYLIDIAERIYGYETFVVLTDIAVNLGIDGLNFASEGLGLSDEGEPLIGTKLHVPRRQRLSIEGRTFVTSMELILSGIIAYSSVILILFIAADTPEEQTRYWGFYLGRLEMLLNSINNRLTDSEFRQQHVEAVNQASARNIQDQKRIVSSITGVNFTGEERKAIEKGGARAAQELQYRQQGGSGGGGPAPVKAIEAHASSNAKNEEAARLQLELDAIQAECTAAVKDATSKKGSALTDQEKNDIQKPFIQKGVPLFKRIKELRGEAFKDSPVNTNGGGASK
jgi:hypothetical protein